MITVAVLGFVFGLSVRAGWDLIKYLIRRKKKSPPPPIEKFGHPYDPVELIRSMLPALDWPYVWESWVEGEIFHLRAVDLTDTSPQISGVTINLESPWKLEYRRWREIPHAVKLDFVEAVELDIKKARPPVSKIGGKKNYQLG